MIDFDTAVRLGLLQERIRNATWWTIKNDGGPHKSSEGAITLSFVLPPVVGDDRDPYWTVELWSYLLCEEGRRKTVSGKTAAEAISKAEDVAEVWCFAAEMAQFEQRMGVPDEDFADEHPAPKNDGEE